LFCCFWSCDSKNLICLYNNVLYLFYNVFCLYFRLKHYLIFCCIHNLLLLFWCLCWHLCNCLLVEMKFKFLQNISHYYNNEIAFHMPMFTISILSLNKLNIIIHSNIRFMIIAYNQNFHFRIHYKRLYKQDYNSFHHNLTLHEIHTKDEHGIHCRSLCFFVLLKTWIQTIA